MFSLWRFFLGVINESSINLKSRHNLYVNYPNIVYISFIPVFYSLLRVSYSLPFVILLSFYSESFNFNYAEGLLLVLWVVFFIFNSFTISILCSFSKDFANLVNLAMSMIMLITPVLWSAEKFGDNWIYLLINPLSIPMIILDKFVNTSSLDYIDTSILIYASFFWFVVFFLAFLQSKRLLNKAFLYLGI